MSAPADYPQILLRRRKVKTTIDLPADLVRSLQLNALRRGRKLNVGSIEILRAGIGAVSTHSKRKLVAKTLPVLKIRPSGSDARSPLSAQEMSDWIKVEELRIEARESEKTPGR
jgi:hypothetical protein